MKRLSLSLGAMLVWGGCGGSELEARSTETTGFVEQRGSTGYAVPPTPTTGTKTYTRTNLTKAQCDVTQQMGRSMDGTKMYSYCVVTCKGNTAINMHNTLQANQQVACGSPSTGGANRSSQSVECSGPYTPGGYLDYCFVDLYFDNAGHDASGQTPVWQF